jgi:hypothetical protein
MCEFGVHALSRSSANSIINSFRCRAPRQSEAINKCRATREAPPTFTFYLGQSECEQKNWDRGDGGWNWISHTSRFYVPFLRFFSCVLWNLCVTGRASKCLICHAAKFANSDGESYGSTPFQVRHFFSTLASALRILAYLRIVFFSI